MTDEWQPPKDVKPWIVCAACRATADVVTSARHFDRLMHEQMNKYYLRKNERWEQGFIDQWGRFYNRKDALKVVKESGQPFNDKRNGGSDCMLYSEGLY